MGGGIPLAAVAVATRPGRIVAIVDGVALSHCDFRRRVAAWRNAFAAAPGRCFAIHLEDTLAFAAALFGAWHADKHVYLCGDNLPATLLGMGDQVDGYAGDVPAAFSPLSPEEGIAVGGEPGPAPWESLDLERTGLSVYTSGSTGDPLVIDKRLRQLQCEVEEHKNSCSCLRSLRQLCQRQSRVENWN